MKMNLCHGLSVRVTLCLRNQAIYCHNVIRHLGGQVQMLPHNVLHVVEGGMVVVMVIMVMMIVIVVMVVIIVVMVVVILVMMVVVVVIMVMVVVIVVMVVVIVVMMVVIVVMVVVVIMVVAFFLLTMNGDGHVRTRNSALHGCFLAVFHSRNLQRV